MYFYNPKWGQFFNSPYLSCRRPCSALWSLRFA
jgi:hypothetical protein